MDHPLLQKNILATVPSTSGRDTFTKPLPNGIFLMCGVPVGWVVCSGKCDLAVPKSRMSISEGRVQAPSGLLVLGL